MLKHLRHLLGYGFEPVHPSSEDLPLVKLQPEGGIAEQVEQNSRGPGHGLHVDLGLQEEEDPVQTEGAVELVGEAGGSREEDNVIASVNLGASMCVQWNLS